MERIKDGDDKGCFIHLFDRVHVRELCRAILIINSIQRQNVHMCICTAPRGPVICLLLMRFRMALSFVTKNHSFVAYKSYIF